MDASPPQLEFSQRDRVLVVAPHPDDEVLATGGLIQCVLAAGAALRVLVATDGDNNPWPQRWAEKRWHVDVKARRRWGERRRTEAAAALAALGVAEQDVCFLGWPDQGTTALLLKDAEAETHLAGEIAAFRPTRIAAPVLDDTHPDHSGLRVLLELAQARVSGLDCQWLGFRVHGLKSDLLASPLALSETQRIVKCDAILEHRSQMILSRRRMLDLAMREEVFRIESTRDMESRRDLQWVMPMPGLRRFWTRHVLALVARIENEVVRITRPLPRSGRSLELATSLRDGQRVTLHVKRVADRLEIGLSSDTPMQQAYAKIERLGERVFIHDQHGWMDVLAATAAEDATAG